MMFRFFKMNNNFKEYQLYRNQIIIPAVDCTKTYKNPTIIKHSRFPILNISDTFKYEKYTEYTLLEFFKR